MSSWAVPEYSRNQVDKAGFVLCNPNSTPDQLDWALDVINNWRSSHSYPLLNFRINLRRKVKSVEQNALVAQRIKRLESINVKLNRRASMQLSQMQDIGGCRAVVSSIRNVNRMVAAYKNSTFAHVFRSEKDYIANPKPDGYRSHHLIYEYKGLPNQNDAWDKLRIEVQLRTKMQHAWATAVEAVGIFTRQALKASMGDQDWLRLFSLLSSEIAAIEKTPLIPNTPSGEQERHKEIIALDKKLRAVKTLDAYRATVKWSETAKELKRSKYFLLRYNYEQNRVFVNGYRQQESEKANADYTRLETAAKDGSENVVLVTVNSVKALRKAFPNYFLDTDELTALLRKVLKK